jgi:23S rRNA (adenine2503-C2)-methyltransferase
MIDNLSGGKMKQVDIKSLNLEELKENLVSLGDKAFRAKQIYDWLHVKLVDSFDEMTNIPNDLREKLKEKCEIITVSPIEIQTSKIDGTQKYLFQLQDGNVIESVLMRYKHGNSVCISSQVGCKMGCRFCASTIGGLERGLTTSEMLSQIYVIQRTTKERVSNVVIMGTGEPMDNYDNFVKFVRILSDDFGLNISQRNITVSTCGIVPRMRQLADEKFQITLALSLHATTNEKRKALMPIANRYSLEEVMDACEYYFKQTGRRITFEYSLVGGVNDTKEDATELIELIKRLNCHVNLIPVNPIKERSFVQSNKKVIDNFKNKLEKCQINVTIRREMGRDIDGACGQLRKSYHDRNAERKF